MLTPIAQAFYSGIKHFRLKQYCPGIAAFVVMSSIYERVVQHPSILQLKEILQPRNRFHKFLFMLVKQVQIGSFCYTLHRKYSVIGAPALVYLPIMATYLVDHVITTNFPTNKCYLPRIVFPFISGIALLVNSVMVGRAISMVFTESKEPGNVMAITTLAMMALSSMNLWVELKIAWNYCPPLKLD